MKEAEHELVSAKANLRSKLSAQRGRSHDQRVSFWIITLMLILVGLSTLKLR
jgi:UDP-N-acetylmuramyl pentapeptide phosphotransferase/UDP-N-acetylglucosamine-1-phosphate transferase